MNEIKQVELSEAEDTRLQKTTAASRTSRAQSKVEQAATGKPRLTKSSLRTSRENYLPLPKKKDPNYKYTWLSMDHNARPNFWDAQENLGFYACSVYDYPDMAVHVFQTKVDNNIASDKIVFKEMILCKLHIEDWQTMMELHHHDKPAEAVADIYRNHRMKLAQYRGAIDDVSEHLLKQEAASESRRDGEVSGIAYNSQGHMRSVKAPKFNL